MASKSKYWTAIREEFDEPDTLFYTADERELWVNELYYLAAESNVELIDYGHVEANGELVSTSSDELF